MDNLSQNLFMTKKNGKPQKWGYTIDRLIWVPQTIGELYYMRTLLTLKKAPTCYDDFKTIEGFKHKFKKKTCFSLDYLRDDKEFIETTK